MGEWAFSTACQTNQSAAKFFQLLRFDCALAFFRTQFHARDQATEIVISLPHGDEQRVAPSAHATDFRADVRLQARFFRREIKPRCAIQPIAVEQRHGWHAVGGACRNQRLGGRSAFEKAESGASMEFDIHQS